jgi:hypothetical protein
MIVTVRDPDILSNLDPQQLTTYLQAQGWQQESQIGNSETVWLGWDVLLFANRFAGDRRRHRQL